MKTFLAVAMAVGCLAGVVQAKVPAEWKPCSKEIQKYCPDAKDSKAIFSCIEGREQQGKQSGLSSACYQAHEKFESPEQESKEKNERGEQHESKEAK